MNNFIFQTKKRLTRSKKTEEKTFPKTDLLKNALTLTLSAALLLFGTIAWFNHGKIPNAIDFKIENPTAMILIEKLNPEDGSYEVVLREKDKEDEEGAEEAEIQGDIFAISIPEMTFYKWEGSVVSSITEDLYYRITVTSRFETMHFSSDPLFYIIPTFSLEVSEELLESITILKAEYVVFDFINGAPEEESFFPDSGFTQMLTNNEMLEFRNIINEKVLVRKIMVGPQERFQSVIYLKISPNTAEVERIIDDLSYSLEPHDAKNKYILSFGFRSTPFHTLPPGEPSTATDEETSVQSEEESSSQSEEESSSQPE